MIVSLNEIESLVLKSARGAGFAWGLAEETAAAAVWLARADLLLIGPLLARLEAAQATSPPVMVGQTIQPLTPGTALCPILTGAWIADQGITIQPLNVLNVLAPLWFSAVIARALPRECQLSIEWQDARLAVSRAGLLGPANDRPLSVSADVAGSIRLMVPRCEEQRNSPVRHAGGVIVRDEDWQALQAFERRTYVPASERSRLAGAGAGLLDGD